MGADARVVIDPRFKGPPDSANGGYVCGLLGRRLEGPFEVTLKAPPPLERELTIEAGGASGVSLLDGETELADGRAVDRLQLEPHVRPSLAAAREASKRFVGLTGHPYPGCFVCGPEADRGLAIFPGPLGGGVHSAALEPREDLPLEGPALAREIATAALDCPSFPWAEMSTMLLGRLTTELLEPIDPARSHVLIGWGVGSEGRKHTTASALLSEEGDLLGRAKAVWIEVPNG